MTATAAAVVGVAAMLGVACSAPAVPPSLKEAEALERQGKEREALEAYDRALLDCKKVPDQRRREQHCAAAHLHRAELLVTMRDVPAAVAAYEAIEAALPEQPTTAAEGLYRAGRLRLKVGDEVGGYRQLWRTVTDYPDEQFAGDALRVVVTDGRRRNPQQLFAVMQPLAAALEKTRVVDNIIYFLAELAEKELEQPDVARTYYDRIWASYPKSGLFDESIWRSAALSRARGDHAGAAERLRRLLATREEAFGAGSYFSVWLDDAQLELGRTLRDGVGDLAAAERAFQQMQEDYPASILRDDATYELAVTRAARRDKAGVCKALDALREQWPDSKYELEKAPALRTKWRCAANSR